MADCWMAPENSVDVVWDEEAPWKGAVSLEPDEDLAWLWPSGPCFCLGSLPWAGVSGRPGFQETKKGFEITMGNT